VRAHGWIGLVVIAVAEARLIADHPVVAHWFTPIAWTGCVLVLDAVVAGLSGRSYLTSR
jgi:hypothetical protein